MVADKNNIKIVFFGTPEFAIESLDKLITNGYNVKAVVTSQDVTKKHKIVQSAVKEYALQHNLNILQPGSVNDPGFISELQKINADIFIVVAFKMLPEIIWSMPKYGTFNLHASLLPQYRGAAPINWAIINGENETGVTTFFINNKIDTGDIIWQEKINIEQNDTFGEVYNKLMNIGATGVIYTLESIINGNNERISQHLYNCDDIKTAPKLFKETCQINWNNTANNIHNFIRGLSPVPGAWSLLQTDNGTVQNIKIYKSLISDKQFTGNIGDIIIDNKQMYVICGDYKTIEILEVQVSGKKQMNIKDYLLGAHIKNSKVII